MDQPVSISGQVISLYERGFTPKEIALELRISRGRVNGILRKAQSRTLDSQRIFEIHEMCLEMVGLLRELAAEKQQRAALRRARTVEKELPHRLGAALERLTRCATSPGIHAGEG